MTQQVPADPVSARLLAWLCLQQPAFSGETMLSKAKWLMSMGISRSEAATILGSTDESIRVMISTDARRAAKR